MGTDLETGGSGLGSRRSGDAAALPVECLAIRLSQAMHMLLQAC